MRDNTVSKIEIDAEEKCLGLESHERRKAVKSIVGSMAALAAYHVIPVKWSSPVK